MYTQTAQEERIEERLGNNFTIIGTWRVHLYILYL